MFSLRIASPTRCLVLPLSFYSFVLLCSPLCSFLLLSSFLEDGNNTLFRV